MADIKLKDKNGTVATYTNVEIFEVPSSVDGEYIDFVNANSGDATAGDILSGKKAFVGTSAVTGTIPTATASDVSIVADVVTVASGYYASAVNKTIPSGTEGTPTATKGEVSNNSIAVTPSVSNSAGYIAGGTHDGMAVTVSASELVSGNKALESSITAQTDVDVTNYATVSVAAMPISTLDSSIISGSSYEESTGDYGWKSTVNVPAGYHSAQTIEKTFSEIFPAPGTPGTADKVLAGYQFYDKDGKVVTGTITSKTEATYTPNDSVQTIAANQYLSGVQTISAVATETKTATANGTVTPTSGKYLSSVTVAIPVYDGSIS